MTNHPNRSTASFRFIAFSTVTGSSLARAATAETARAEALTFHHLADDRFIEVIDCGSAGRKIWSANLLVHKVRDSHRVAFRGAGDDNLPAVELSQGA